MKDELYSRTAAELVEVHNRLCPEGDEVQGPWKASKRELIGRIRVLGDQSTDDQAPEAAEEADERPNETVGATGRGPSATAKGAVGALVREMLMTEAPYERIVGEVRKRFPGAQTTSRSVASVASVLRREGAAVPMRRAKS